MQLAREWVGQRRHILVYQIQKCARIVVCPNCLTSARLEDPRRRRDPGRTRLQVPGAAGWQKTRRSSCCAVLSKLVSIDSLEDGMCRHPWLRAVLRLRLGRRSEEHTSELQSRGHLVCRLLLEKKKHFIILP